jgi:hypothetical protein
MTISINTVADNDVIDATEAEAPGGITLSGSKSNLSFPNTDTVELKIFNSAGTQVYSREFIDDGTTWSHVWFPSSLDDGIYTLSVDLPDDDVDTPATRTFTLDRTRPTASITLSDMKLWPGDTALVTFQFSEAVTGFTAADVGGGLGSISNFIAVDADTYTATLTPNPNVEGRDSVTLGTHWVDAAGNEPDDFFESPTYDIDTKAPRPGILVFSDLTDTGGIETPPITSDGLFFLEQLSAPTDFGSGLLDIEWQRSLDGGTFEATSRQQFNLVDGSYRYRAKYTDRAGNSSTGNVIEVVIDTTAPAAGTLAFANLTDSGSDEAPDITTDSAFDLVLSGQEAGTTFAYEVSNDGGATWSTTTASQTGLADGTYRFRAAVTDAAGNTSTSSDAIVSVDHVAIPGTLAFAGLTDTGSDDATDITTDNAFTLALSGQEASAVATYEISTDGGATWSPTAASQSGLADATYHFRTRVIDAAGNGGIGNVMAVTVDHRAPVAGLLAFANLIGAGGGTTSDDTFDLVLNGQEAGASTAYQVSTDGGSTWLTTGAAQSGLADGTYRYRAFVVDGAGNIAGTNELTVTISHDSAPGLPPVNTVPVALAVEANHALAISGLAVDDGDAGAGTLTTTLSVAHGILTIASAGGAAVVGSGTASVTLTGTLAEINTTLAATANVTYAPAHDFFGLDTLTVQSNDGLLTDIDVVPIQVDTLLTGTAGDDGFAAPAGTARIDAFGGDDAIAFGFRLVDATVSHEGTAVIIDGPNGSHTVLTGFETFVFTDGTVDNGDGSPLIDDLFYYSRHHDVWTAHTDADQHFNAIGWKQGHDPSAFFDTSIYLAANPDVAASGVNPLTHYDTIGWKQARAPSLEFDGRVYLDANPDVKAAGMDPLLHFLAVGASEGREPIAPTALATANGFDFVYYLASNPDVAAADVDPFWHFQNIGWKEGRNPNAYFDTAGYLAVYADVAAAQINPLDHYNASGWHEGRDPSLAFDTASYRAANADVAAAHVNPLAHFLQSGHYEGRAAIADGTWG